MNVALWGLQVLLAVHTAIGAVWKFSHTPAQTMPSLAAIPNGAWLAMSVIELLCAAGLVLPFLNRSFDGLAAIAAIVIAAEMLLFCLLHVSSGASGYSSIAYWLVVAVVCAFIAWGRLAMRP